MKQSRYKVILTALFRECGKETAWYLLMMIAAAFLGPAQLLFKGRILDAALSGKGNLLWEMLCFAAAACLAFLAGYGSNVGEQRMKQRLYGRFSTEVLDKFSRIHYAAYESEVTMNVIRRMGDAPQEHILGFFNAFLAVASGIVSALCYGAVFASLSPWCLVLGLFAFGAMLFFDFRRIRLMTELYQEQTMEERLMDSYGQILGSRPGLYDLRVAGAVPYILKKRKEISDRIVKERYTRTVRSQLAYAYGEMTIVAWMAIVLFFSVSAFMKGTFTIGLFVALVGALQQILGTFRGIGDKYSELQRRVVSVDYYMAFMELEEGPGEKPKAPRDKPEVSMDKPRTSMERLEVLKKSEVPMEKPEVLARKSAMLVEKPEMPMKKPKVPMDRLETVSSADSGIRFEHVTFTYPGQKEPALRDVSFTLESGIKMALVGHNGSGKSTLIKLLCGLYQPDSGRILIDGRDVTELNPKTLQRFFSVIFQDYGRYFFTVQENVELGDVEKARRAGDMREQEVRAALQKGLAEGLAGMLRQPLGNLSPEGVELSGGQWQRLALSRACYRDCQVLVLDEPTAALDPVAENELYANFVEMMKGRSCILISHRLAVARYTDRILVLQKGVLIEEGDHASLMGENGVYASMYRAQSHWYAGRKSRPPGSAPE